VDEGLYATRVRLDRALPLDRGRSALVEGSSATIDGEAVRCGDNGISDFEKLHSRAYDHQVFLYAFDLLELNGEDWRG
jgi:ATP-dependent DNA ligase